MRRLQVLFILIFGSALIFLMTGCGGGSSNTTTATQVVLAPATLSLNRGDVVQISATPRDSSGSNVAADITYTSSNSSLVSISNSGLVCAGKWDTNFVVCTPATSTGTATVTATVTLNTAASASSTVYVHERVDRVQMDPTATSCLSAGQTELLTATAYSLNPTVCTGLGASAPCALPKSSLGAFTFATADPDVVTIDNTTVPGNATGRGPGLTTVTATVSNVNSPAQSFLVCPITKLVFTNGTDQSPITLAKAATQTMDVTAVDSAGVTLTNPPVTYVSNNNYGVTIAAAATASTATATGANSGSSSLLFAACVPPTCNKNLNAVYSSGIMGTVSGTYNAPTVLVASTKSLNLIPVDMSNSSVGTAVALPYLPNSFLMNRQGTEGIMGSDSNPLMLISAAGPTVSTIAAITGAKALAVSPDGTYALVSNTAGTFVINLTSSSATASSNFGSATKGAFSPDSKFAFFTLGTSTLYTIDLTSGRTLIYNEGSAINDIAVSGNAALTYFAQTGAINAVGNCNLQNAGFADTQPASAPSMLTTVPNGSGVLAVDGANLLYVNLASVSQACPPAVSESITSIPLGLSSAPHQVLATLDGKFAVVPSTSQIDVVTLSSSAVAPATLSGGATVSGIGDLTGDSASLFIGGSDNALHKIDLATAKDVAQVAISTLKDANSNVVAPDLVGVRNK